MLSTMRSCNVPECERLQYALGLCNKHWQRQRRTGSTDTERRIPPSGMSLRERFKFYGWTPTGSGCWVWSGPIEVNGYGTLKVKGKTHKAHRVSYELHHGTIPEGFAVLHSCDNPPCVNPDHLRAGTWADNAQDREKRQRSGVSKLSPDQVRKIRALVDSGETQVSVAEKYSISYQSVSRIARRESWQHV